MDEAKRLQRFVDALDEDQKEFFYLHFPVFLHNWFNASYAKSEMKVAPNIELSSIHNSSKIESRIGTSADYLNFIIAWYHLRQIFVPRISKGKTIYRLTSIDKIPNTKILTFKNANQHKSTTSWTLNPDPIVGDRYTKVDMKDIILSYPIQGTKHVLFDYDSAYRLAKACISIQGLDKLAKRLWTATLNEVQIFNKEREVVIFLNSSDSLECTWKIK